MDANRFDAWTLALTAAGSRRALVGALLGGALGGMGGGLGGHREAAAGDREAGQRCKRNAQCITEICAGPRGRKTCRCADGLKTCPATSNNCCVAPLVCRDGQCVNHCQSGRKDRDETDVDCGGDLCPKCGPLKRCAFDTDCESGHCDDAFRCSECTTDEQCPIAGLPASFEFCVDHQCKQCRLHTDCDDRFLCESNRCIPHCDNGRFDPTGTETDVDCGGICPKKCRAGQRCKVNFDCASNFCHPTERRCLRSCERNTECPPGQFCLDCCVGCDDGNHCFTSSVCPNQNCRLPGESCGSEGACAAECCSGVGCFGTCCASGEICGDDGTGSAACV
jgi:hypothetical protein